MKALIPLLIVFISTGARAEVLARVDGEELTWEQLLEQAGGIEALRYMGIDSESSATQILDTWVRERLVLSAARDAGILGRSDVQKLIQEATDRILIEAYLGDLLDGIEVSRLEIDNYLDIWRDTYNYEYKVRHILLDSRVLASSVRSRLASGETFESLAATFSSCPSAREGGNIGWIRRGKAPGPFMEAVCSLEPGELSDVVETAVGFHLIELLDRRNLAAPPSNREVLQIAGEEIVGARQEKVVMELLAALRGEHSISLYPRRLLERL